MVSSSIKLYKETILVLQNLDVFQFLRQLKIDISFSLWAAFLHYWYKGEKFTEIQISQEIWFCFVFFLKSFKHSFKNNCGTTKKLTTACGRGENNQGFEHRDLLSMHFSPFLQKESYSPIHNKFINKM